MSSSPAQQDDAGGFTRLGWISAAVVFGGLFIWSVFAPINSAVIAPGHLSVETNRKTIQHLEGGVIRKILVKEGQTVEAGELLIELDDTVTRSNVDLLTAQLSEGVARLARLYAERDGLSEIPEDSIAFRLRPDDLDVSANLAGQASLLAARETTRKTQIALLEERMVQQMKRIGGNETQIRSLREQARLVGEELEGVKRLNAEGFAPTTRVRELERAREALGGQQGQLVAAVAEAESIISETKLEIERLKQQAREDAIDESQDLEVQVAGLIERRTAALEALRRSEIRAPEAGEVLGLAFHTIGGVIGPGTPVMDIVPKGDDLVVAARIAPRDVDKVKPGQEAVIRFSALNMRTTPEALGSVRQVSADNMVDKETGFAYFLVLIDLPPEDELEPILQGQPLLPGMPAESFIRTGARPAISYLLKPLTDAFSRALREE